MEGIWCGGLGGDCAELVILARSRGVGFVYRLSSSSRRGYVKASSGSPLVAYILAILESSEFVGWRCSACLEAREYRCHWECFNPASSDSSTFINVRNVSFVYNRSDRNDSCKPVVCLSPPNSVPNVNTTRPVPCGRILASSHLLLLLIQALAKICGSHTESRLTL